MGWECIWNSHSAYRRVNYIFFNLWSLADVSVSQWLKHLPSYLLFTFGQDRLLHLHQPLHRTMCPQLSLTHSVGRRILYLNTNAIHAFQKWSHHSQPHSLNNKYHWQGNSSLGTKTIAFLFHTPWIHASNTRCPWNISFYRGLPISLVIFQLTSD